MENFGKVLKRVLKARGMSQKDLACDKISKQAISLYIRGKREPSSRTFCELVKRVGSTLEEFYYEMNDYELEEFNSILEEAKRLYYEKDILELKRLLKEEQERVDSCEYRQDFTCLMIKNTISRIDADTSLTDAEKTKIVDYLSNTTHWGYYELSLFNNTVESFDSSSLAILSEELILRTEFYNEIPTNKSLIVQTIINVMLILVCHNEFDVVIKLKTEIEDLLDDDDILFRTLLLFIMGMLELSMGINIDEAKKKAMDAISVFKTVGSLRLAENYQDSYDKAIHMLEEMEKS